MRVVKLNKRARPACKRKGTSPRSAHRISPSPNRPVYLPSRHMKKKDEKKITRKLPNKTYFRAHLSLLRKRCTEALSARPAALARSPPCENQTTGPLHRPPSQFTALSPGHAQFRGFHPRNALRPSHGPAPGGPLYETLGVHPTAYCHSPLPPAGPSVYPVAGMRARVPFLLLNTTGRWHCVALPRRRTGRSRPVAGRRAQIAGAVLC